MPNKNKQQEIPSQIIKAADLADASWRPILLDGLQAMMEENPAYLPTLVNEDYLPSRGWMFGAFTQPLPNVHYVLVGEGPYPREESATGVCFMDGAVKELWSEKGLSKPVNRATSLRNFMKMLLVTEGYLSIEKTSGDALAIVAEKALHPENNFIQTLPDLQENLTRHGFLLLNASLVYRPNVPPLKEAKAWQPLLQKVLCALADHADTHAKTPPTLVLWGKVAELLSSIPENSRFPKAISEHPYNLSFISNPVMQALFGPMRLLQKQDS
ncbi:uracil-DNA glycosylase [Oxalobacteraceae bacterium R-40]|uniref:Uracil-DNA glycosylase n=1 Tax=Keguizhuia sedimenti TaxID=3064264 RepID=A0ABU1BT87_9BURK|nr:uracil-DNA glycosylase [Oxalobacteraceae bacterium R-40]